MLRAGLTRQRRRRDMAFISVFRTISAGAVDTCLSRETVRNQQLRLSVRLFTYANWQQAVLLRVDEKGRQMRPQFVL